MKREIHCNILLKMRCNLINIIYKYYKMYKMMSFIGLALVSSKKQRVFVGFVVDNLQEIKL